ncbi:MAG: ATP-binding protein [Nitrospirota bacterium]
MGETRVNLKRLLEDIRDSYPVPVAEVILTELIANSLDSGASSIWFAINRSERALTVIDNGRGMKGSDLTTYHDIAASTKLRGKGIGFAGIGAKLALLVAQEVITETKMARKHQATSWSLSGPMRAPWKPIAPPGLLKEPTGTAVCIKLPEGKSDGEPLVQLAFIRDTLMTHFAPLLDEELLKRLGRLYANPIAFFLDDRPLLPDPLPTPSERRFFYVRIAKTKRPVGVGFLMASDQEFPEQKRGIAISTYGKVIKGGWEWLGITPVRPGRMSGMLEIPALAQILTTNKADFLKDAGSVRTFYRFRKGIQLAIEPILTELGEQPIAPAPSAKLLGATDRMAIQAVLTEMVAEYPELEPLVGTQRSTDGKEVETLETLPRVPLFDQQEETTPTLEGEPPQNGLPHQTDHSPPLPTATNESLSLEGIKREEILQEISGETKRARKKSALAIGVEDDPTRKALGWLSDETIWINKGHPAYKKAAEMGHERYHTVVTVGWVLASHVGNADAACDFLARYLSYWGRR